MKWEDIIFHAFIWFPILLVFLLMTGVISPNDVLVYGME
jgi:hypothetical protein